MANKINKSCFCKHGNLGQHETTCPQVPMHILKWQLDQLNDKIKKLKAELRGAKRVIHVLQYPLGRAND